MTDGSHYKGVDWSGLEDIDPRDARICALEAELDHYRRTARRLVVEVSWLQKRIHFLETGKDEDVAPGIESAKDARELDKSAGVEEN